MAEANFEEVVIKELASIKKLDSKSSLRIIEAIEKLAEDPVPHDAKRIYSTNEKLFRIRVGDFRVLYRIDYGKIIMSFSGFSSPLA